jgi:uncharacterized membrane protein
MNQNKKSFIFLVLFIWTIYFAWSMDMQTIAEIQPKTTTRYDLWILPYLLAFTGYAVYLLTRRKDSDNNQV